MLAGRSKAQSCLGFGLPLAIRALLVFRVVSLSGLVAVGATLTSNLLAQPGTLGDPATFLPPGARVEDPARHVILEDLDGDGKEEAVIFYQKAEEDRRTAGVVVLAHEGNDYGQVWSREKEPSRGAIDPSGVKNLLGRGAGA